MPTATAAPRGTREMRLASAALGAAGPLSTFIAQRRLPGDTWRSWEQISLDLHTEIGELITREGIRRWAIRLGIPDHTKPDDGPGLVSVYRTTLKRAGIRLNL